MGWSANPSTQKAPGGVSDFAPGRVNWSYHAGGANALGALDPDPRSSWQGFEVLRGRSFDSEERAGDELRTIVREEKGFAHPRTMSRRCKSSARKHAHRAREGTPQRQVPLEPEVTASVPDRHTDLVLNEILRVPSHIELALPTFGSTVPFGSGIEHPKKLTRPPSGGKENNNHRSITSRHRHRPPIQSCARARSPIGGRDLRDRQTRGSGQEPFVKLWIIGARPISATIQGERASRLTEPAEAGERGTVREAHGS